MEIIDAIKECKTLTELDNLQEDIHFAASRNEIDFKQVKQIFLAKKKELVLKQFNLS